MIRLRLVACVGGELEHLKDGNGIISAAVLCCSLLLKVLDILTECTTVALWYGGGTRSDVFTAYLLIKYGLG